MCPRSDHEEAPRIALPLPADGRSAPAGASEPSGTFRCATTGPQPPVEGAPPSPGGPEASAEPSPSTEAFAHLVHRASELLRDRRPAEAREHLRRAVAMFPDNAAARSLLGLSCFQAGQLEQAAAIYESLELRFPRSIAAKLNLALARLKLGQPALALQLLQNAVGLDPTHRRAWGYLGVALEQLGRIDEAEQALLAGHFTGAASGLRRRHARDAEGAHGKVADVTAEGARTAMPAVTYRRRTLPPDPWTTSVAGGAKLAFTNLARYEATLRPPDFVPDADRALAEGEAPDGDAASRRTGAPSDGVDEIPVDTAVTPLPLPPGTPTGAPKQNRPVIPLLDAALSSLLVVPHEASVVTHPAGLVLVGLTQGDARDGGFAAHVQSVLATAGSLRREAIPRRSPLAAQTLGPEGAFVRIAGTGQLVLRPPPGSRLLPLQMDADVAFLRDEFVVAFDLGLLCDLGRIRQPSGAALSLVRFRGDGVIVLEIPRPFLALDVRGEEAMSLRTDTLIGWIGLLAPEPADANGAAGGEFMTFSGEGTVLFQGPLDS